MSDWRKKAARLLKVFLEGNAARTNAAYASDLDKFAVFIGAEDRAAAVARLLRGGQGAAYELAMRCHNALLTKKKSASTINRRLAALKSLIEMANTIGLIRWKLHIEPLEARAYRDTHGPGRENYLKMVRHVRERGGEKSCRDLAILHLLYDLALRAGEVVNLDVEHVRIRSRRISIMGKGRRQREWYELPLETQEVLAAWMVTRGNEPGPLFTSFWRVRRGGRLTYNGVYWVVRKAGEAIGCRTSPHGFRHSAITDAMQMGHTPADVQKFSRHKDLRTLQLYYDQARTTQGEIASDLAKAV